MSVTLRIPTPLRPVVGGKSELILEGMNTVQDLIVICDAKTAHRRNYLNMGLVSAPGLRECGRCAGEIEWLAG